MESYASIYDVVNLTADCRLLDLWRGGSCVHSLQPAAIRQSSTRRATSASFLWHLYSPTTLELSVILLSCKVFILTALSDSRWFDPSPQQRQSPFFNLLLLVDIFHPRGPRDVPQSVQQEALHHPASDRPSHPTGCSPQKQPSDHHHPALLVEEEDAFHFQQVGGWSVRCRCDSETFFLWKKNSAQYLSI